MASTPQSNTVDPGMAALLGAALSIETVMALGNKGVITKAEGDAILKAALSRFSDPTQKQQARAMILGAITNAGV